MNVIEAEGERCLKEVTTTRPDDFAKLWSGLDLAIRKAPAVRLISSESLRKERSQVRILKDKSRLIKQIERLATAWSAGSTGRDKEL